MNVSEVTHQICTDYQQNFSGKNLSLEFVTRCSGRGSFALSD
jgi:hypothetical protein